MPSRTRSRRRRRQSDGDGGRWEPDQSDLDGIDGQCWGDRVSGGAVPGCWVHELCADWDGRGHGIQRHGSDWKHHLPLPGAGDGLGRKPEPILERGPSFHRVFGQPARGGVDFHADAAVHGQQWQCYLVGGWRCRWIGLFGNDYHHGSLLAAEQSSALTP